MRAAAFVSNFAHLARRAARNTTVCSRSLSDDMSPVWHIFEREIAAQPMPDEFAASTATVLCNDCGARSTVPFHFVGHRCASEQCHGYNTRVLETHNMPVAQVPNAANDSDGAGNRGDESNAGEQT